MKLLADFFPVILFFLAYKLGDLYIATGVAIAASFVQVGYGWMRRKKLEKMHLVTLVTLLVLGGLTLLLHDRTFIMWKPSLVYWALGAALLISQFFGKKPLIRRMLEEHVALPDLIWRRLNLAWAFMFVGIGLLNLYVASGFFAAETQLLELSGLQQVDFDNCGKLFQGNQLELCNTAHSLEQGWVNFKLFGILGVLLIFSLLQGFYLMRHMPDSEVQHEDK